MVSVPGAVRRLWWGIERMARAVGCRKLISGTSKLNPSVSLGASPAPEGVTLPECLRPSAWKVGGKPNGLRGRPAHSCATRAKS
jgi:hypothetical protein